MDEPLAREHCTENAVFFFSFLFSIFNEFGDSCGSLLLFMLHMWISSVEEKNERNLSTTTGLNESNYIDAIKEEGHV